MNTTQAQAQAHTGVTYHCELVRDGRVIDAWEAEKLMPEEGRNYMLGVAIKAVAQLANWYLGVFENNAFPADNLKASTAVAVLGETTTYVPPTRPAFVGGTVAAGAVDNTASRAEFTFNAAKRIYGAFMVSSPTKGSGAGVLISAARFDNYKDVESGDTLRVTASFNLISST